MQPIIYDVAVSADGFIAGPYSDVSAFPHQGAIVDDYLARLARYSTALMGRRTYEFGLKHGLALGANPYPAMRCIVVSSTLNLPGDNVEVWRDLAGLNRLRQEAPSPIYLCGGGVLASAIARAGHLTQLTLKRAPVVLGAGTPLFAGLEQAHTLHLVTQKDYGEGSLLQSSRFS
ncbi:dihydrofolate reductase family protein [Gymnodinialimonas sp. 57CJ19]|uniref:dihydrofolate reductase family protein n=1 Tax=Gymnodinialimonas sp. 57CJ19 TaxID=3138498 RepID=UPI003134397A